MHLIGLTGGIATGKSLVSRELARLGAHIIDADLIARELTEPGQPGWQRIREEFGEVFFKGEELDRKALGRLVFADPEARKKINDLLHPLIIATIGQRIRIYSRFESKGVIVIDAPLLFEVGLNTMVDQVWVVTASPQTQLKRLMERDNLSEVEARQRIAAQMPLAEKVARADFVIDNDGRVSETLARVARMMNDLTGKSIR